MLKRSHGLPGFFKIRITEEDFQQTGKQEAFIVMFREQFRSTFLWNYCMNTIYSYDIAPSRIAFYIWIKSTEKKNGFSLFGRIQSEFLIQQTASVQYYREQVACLNNSFQSEKNSFLGMKVSWWLCCKFFHMWHIF